MFTKGWLKAGIIGTAVSIVLAVLGVIPFISCLICPITCVSWFVIPLFSGFLAATWDNVGNDYTSAAKSGALAGLIIGIVSGFVSLILNVISSVFNFGLSSSYSYLEDQNLADFTFLPVGIGGAIICGSIGFIFGIIINVVIALLGGIIKAAMNKD